MIFPFGSSWDSFQFQIPVFGLLDDINQWCLPINKKQGMQASQSSFTSPVMHIFSGTHCQGPSYSFKVHLRIRVHDVPFCILMSLFSIPFWILMGLFSVTDSRFWSIG